MENGYDLESALAGCLLGGAVGDALGLPREGLNPAKAQRLFGVAVRHCFVRGRGMVSDDTEHALMTACALAESAGEPQAFTQSLARSLRHWLLLFPAGAGLATLRAAFRLWCHISPERSGVYSAGNGPLMRAAVLGVAVPADAERLQSLVRASTRLTHTDPRAERGALIVARAASLRLRRGPSALSAPAPEVCAELLHDLGEHDEELRALGQRASATASLQGHWPQGPSGYVYDSLLAVLHTWLHNRDHYTEAIQKVIGLGGDTDTTAAVLGGIAGGNLGADHIPPEWLDGLWEWPRGIPWMLDLAHVLAQGTKTPPHWGSGRTMVRNVLFLGLVLGHGFRRLLR